MKQALLIDPFEDIVNLQSHFLASKSIESRKALGQFFTGLATSQYMASLLCKPRKKDIRILDAGAGTGILSACAALQCLNFDCRSVHSVVYEIDPKVTPYLEQTLKVIQNTFTTQSKNFTYEIRNEDFVLSRPDKSGEQYDLAVINPPYFKYSVKESPYSGAVADLYSGDPNIYASFMAVVLSCLCNHGQMVSITPRSFTNGLYFRGFRSYLLNESSLDTIHIFRHRDKVFKNADSSVLQENIICKFVRGCIQGDVTICSSNCDSSINDSYIYQYPFSLIVDSSNSEKIIRIPDSPEEAKILEDAEKLPSTFTASGYFISTGRAVEHRTRSYISTDHSSHETVPLYRPHNITPIVSTWTGLHKKDVSFLLNENYEKHVNENYIYVLLKRFSSKDEKRRLVSSVYIPDHSKYIAFGNKINYIGRKDSTLDKIEAFGLAAVFNSTFMDKYFRCISGNTQVNATEIRVMKFPTRNQILEIGKQSYSLTEFSTASIDHIVNEVLGLKDYESTGKIGAGKKTSNRAGLATSTV